MGFRSRVGTDERWILGCRNVCTRSMLRGFLFLQPSLPSQKIQMSRPHYPSPPSSEGQKLPRSQETGEFMTFGVSIKQLATCEIEKYMVYAKFRSSAVLGSRYSIIVHRSRESNVPLDENYLIRFRTI